MSDFDPRRDPAKYPEPATMSDADLYAEWETVQEQWDHITTAEKAMTAAADAAAAMALLSLPEKIRTLFQGVQVEANAQWSARGCAIANRYSDLADERTARSGGKDATW